MRLCLALLLPVAAAAAGDATVGDARTFEMPLPAGDEWEAGEPGGEAKAFVKTEFADSDPKAVAEVRVMTYALPTALAAKGLDAIAHEWAATIEERFASPRAVEEGKSELGGEQAWFRDVRTGSARLTWHLSRKGDLLFVFHVIRTNKAADDGKVEEQVAHMRASFRFLTTETPPPPEPPPVKEEIPAAQLARGTLTFDHWRFACVKPEGLVHVPPERLDAKEKESGVVAKFERAAEQTRIMVRIYAQSASAQRFTIDQLAAQKLERFEETYDKASRNPPKRDDAWKFPMARQAILLELTGRGRTLETTRWILAQCGNGRQYQIEIFVRGGDPGRWSSEIRDLLEGFRPLKRSLPS